MGWAGWQLFSMGKHRHVAFLGVAASHGIDVAGLPTLGNDGN